MKVHHVKALILLLTVCLTLNLPSIAWSKYKDYEEGDGPKSEVDSDKAAQAYAAALAGLDGVAADEGNRRADNAEGSGSGLVALQSSSRVEHGVSSSRSQMEKAVNELTLCKLDFQKQEIECLKHADPSNISAKPSCRTKFAPLKLGCTESFFIAVTKLPNPPISGSGPEAALARQKDAVAKASRMLEFMDRSTELQKGEDGFQSANMVVGIVDALANNPESGVSEKQTSMITDKSLALTRCIQNARGSGSASNYSTNNIITSAGDESTQVFEQAFRDRIDESRRQLDCALTPLPTVGPIE